MQSAVLKDNAHYKVNPKQFTLWVFLVSVTMLFAGFTSAYIVRKAEGNWMQFELPSVFQISLLVALLSSAVMAGAQLTLKVNKGLSHLLTFMALGGGIAFVITQLMGWERLVQEGIFLVGNASAGFLYLISGLHLAHVLGGLIALIVLVINMFKRNKDHKTSMTSTAVYWHFVGLLWVYLFLFFKFV